MPPSICVCAIILCVLVLSCAVCGSAQVNAATLSGAVTDPQGLAVRSAKVAVTKAATGAERTIAADDEGRYTFIGLVPGKYKISVDGGANFGLFQSGSIVVTVGEDATFNPRLELQGVTQTVTVTTETANIDTSKTEVPQTVEAPRIAHLPINGPAYPHFTPLTSHPPRPPSPT